MAKVVCAETRCKHNVDCECQRKEINLSCANISTTHEGRKDVWYCRMFQISDFAREIDDMLEKFFEQKRSDNNAK